MKEDIISQKIRRELENLPIDTEPRVMYLLIEIRKVLEHANTKKSLLYFYGNWVVHTKMDKAIAKKLFDEISNNESELGNYIKSFELLKNELRVFFEKHSLPTNLIDEHWGIFRDKLLDILIDTPIMNNTGDKSFGFYKSGTNNGVQFYIKEGESQPILGRVWI